MPTSWPDSDSDSDEEMESGGNLEERPQGAAGGCIAPLHGRTAL